MSLCALFGIIAGSFTEHHGRTRIVAEIRTCQAVAQFHKADQTHQARFRATSRGGIPPASSGLADSNLPAVILRGRPPVRPSFLAASSPARVRSTINSRSICARLESLKGKRCCRQVKSYQFLKRFTRQYTSTSKSSLFTAQPRPRTHLSKKTALRHFPGDFHAVKKVSFPQKKRIRVR